MRDTVEERIRSILERKGLLHAEIIDGLSESEFEEALTIDDLLGVLDLNRHDVEIPQPQRAQSGEMPPLVTILELLGTLEPAGFENAAKLVFQHALGFSNARVTGQAGDGGIDIEATKMTRGGLERIVVQCKRMPTVGPGIARELLGVVAADPSITKGYLVTSGQPTAACREFCRKQGRLELVSGMQLARWIREHAIEIPSVTVE